MLACMYVCLSVCMSVCMRGMYVCLFVCLFACLYGCRFVCIHIYTFIRIQLSQYVYIQTYMSLYIHMHKLLSIWVSICAECCFLNGFCMVSLSSLGCILSALLLSFLMATGCLFFCLCVCVFYIRLFELLYTLWVLLYVVCLWPFSDPLFGFVLDLHLAIYRCFFSACDFVYGCIFVYLDDLSAAFMRFCMSFHCSSIWFVYALCALLSYNDITSFLCVWIHEWFGDSQHTAFYMNGCLMV